MGHLRHPRENAGGQPREDPSSFRTQDCYEVTPRLSRRNPKNKDGDQNRNNKQLQKNKEEKIESRTIIVSMLYGLVSGLFFAACAASVKYLDNIDPGQVAFYQYTAITALALPMVVRSGENALGPDRTTRYWFFLSGFLDAMTVYLSFVSFRRLPLSDATVITSSVPVFVTLAARVFLKERCGRFQTFAIVISVAGVALVSKLPLLVASRSQDVYTRESITGLLAALGATATESGVYLILRKLRDVNNFVILFNCGMVTALANALLTISIGDFTWTMCGAQQGLVLAVGVFSFFSQLSLTKALEMENAGPVAVLMAAGDIILAFVLDMTLFQDTPDVYTIAGTVLVVSSVMLIGSGLKAIPESSPSISQVLED